jgi:hypothetical protein
MSRPPAEAPAVASQAAPVQRTDEDAHPVQRADDEELQGSFVQRQGEEDKKDEEMVQGAFVQRQESPEEEKEQA